MAERSWAETRELVHQRANGCCEYCRASEYNTGQPMHVDHIDPKGGDDLDNLCLACASCNLSKGSAISTLDTATAESVPLFHPRRQSWEEHFVWLDGVRIAGRTPVGRATVERLKMNQERLIRARRNWVAAGEHPPE